MSQELYTGVDLGSYAVKIVVAQASTEGDFQVLACAHHSSEGVSKGSVSSLDDAVSSLSGALEKAERMAGRPISRATVGLSNVNIASQESRGVVAVSRADGEIKESDVDRAIEAAQAIATPPNHEILHVIPLHFAVDSQLNVKDPVGMSGVRLEVTAQIVQALSSEVKSLTKVIYRTGLEINDLVLSVLACAEGTLSRRQKELGVALVNIGASTTSVTIFEEGDMLYAGVIPIGSAHITSDLAIGLRTSIEVAEKVKLAVGHVGADRVSKRDTLDLSDFSKRESGKVALSEVVKIMRARLEEIFDYVNDRFTQVSRAGRLPAGVVLTGGGAKLPGMIEVAKSHFRLPASLGYVTALGQAIEKARGLEFTTAAGLALWDRQWQGERGSSLSLPGLGAVSGVLSRVGSKIKGIIR